MPGGEFSWELEGQSTTAKQLASAVNALYQGEYACTTNSAGATVPYPFIDGKIQFTVLFLRLLTEKFKVQLRRLLT